MQNNINTEYRFLRVMPFKALSIWDAKKNDLINSLYQDNQQLFKLSELLKLVKRNVSLQDNVEYNLLGISSYGNGAFHRDSKKGKNISAKTLSKIETGDIVYSRLGASTGSFALVGKCYNNYYVSNEFPSFKLKDNTKVNPIFLINILTSKRFYNLISVQNTGSALKRFHESRFLKLEIPLPALPEQKNIVKAYQDKITQAEKLEQDATNLEEQIEEYLLSEIGVNKRKQKLKTESRNRLLFFEFKNLKKWSLNAILREEKYSFEDTKYTSKPISLLIKNFVTGKTPSKSKKSKYWENGNFHWVSPKDFNGLTIDTSQDRITEIAVKETKIKIHPIGTILCVFRSGILRHSFPIAITSIEATINQDLKAIQLDNDLIINKYFVFYLKILQAFVLERASKVGVTVESINSDEFLNIPVIIPSLNVQQNIVKSINQMKETQKQKFEKAQQLRQQALIEFENTIFKPV